MPLPAALLERLKKRKIIQDTNDGTSNKPKQVENPEASGHSIVTSSRNSNDQVSKSIRKHDINDKDRLYKGCPETNEGDQSVDDDNDVKDGNAVINQHGTDIFDTPTTPWRQASETIESSSSSQTESMTTTTNLATTTTTTERVGSVDGSDDETETYESIIGCPNKYNIYHVCSQYCRDRYMQINDEHMEPTREQRKQLALLLKTFPMSNEWTVVYDPGVRTFYFWNIITGHVSWGPPGMGAFASPSANEIRKTYMDSERQQQQQQQQQSESRQEEPIEDQPASVEVE